jgi:hypothetical protein
MLGLGCGVGTARDKTPAASQKVSAPTPEDLHAKVEQTALVAAAVRSRYGLELKRTEEDLAVLQRLVDDKAFSVRQTYEWQCVGIALGEVFASQTPLRWVIVEDELGRDMALEYPGTTVLVYPRTMVSKRVEQGRDIPLRALYIATRDQAESMKQEYKR